MTFELKTPTEVKLTSVTSLVLKHGDKLVPAISLSFHYSGPNTILDMIDKSLRPCFYKAADTKDIPDVEPTTPVLMTRSIDKLKLRNSWEEMVTIVEHGIGDTADSITSVKSGDCKVHNFRDIDLHDGGMVDFTFSVNTADVSKKDVGTLWNLNGNVVRLTVRKPEGDEVKKTPAAIDGTVGHPGVKVKGGKGKAKEETGNEAGDLFAATHGGESAAPDTAAAPAAQEGNDAGAPAADVQAPEAPAVAADPAKVKALSDKFKPAPKAKAAPAKKAAAAAPKKPAPKKPSTPAKKAPAVKRPAPSKKAPPRKR